MMESGNQQDVIRPLRKLSPQKVPLARYCTTAGCSTKIDSGGGGVAHRRTGGEETDALVDGKTLYTSLMRFWCMQPQ